MNPLIPISISILSLVIALISLSRSTTYKTLDLKTTLVARALALQAELAAFMRIARELDRVTAEVNDLSSRLQLDRQVTPYDRVKELDGVNKWAEQALELARISEGVSSISTYRKTHDLVLEMTEKMKIAHQETATALAEGTKLLERLKARAAT